MTSCFPLASVKIHPKVPWPIRLRPPSVEMVLDLTLIEYKYHLGLLLLEKDLFKEASPFADYIIQHLPKYKSGYHLKARALVELKRLDEALNVYDDVITLAPNYVDLHAGRLDVISVLIDRQERARQDNSQRFH